MASVLSHPDGIGKIRHEYIVAVVLLFDRLASWAQPGYIASIRIYGQLGAVLQLVGLPETFP